MKRVLHSGVGGRARVGCARSWVVLAWFCLAALGSWVLPAQEAIGPFISTVGTTVRNPATGQDWAYVLWTANSPTLLHGRTHAVYAKRGDASATGEFARQSMVSLQTEAVTLGPLLARAAALGDDTNTLSTDLDALFGKFVPAGLPLADRLSAVVRGALVEERHYGRLILLARGHPSVALALGFGYAAPLEPGTTTFEVREFDRGTQTDGAVIGRVTITAGQPVVLPAPAPAVVMPADDSRGHLNVQLRWGVPDALRRLSLLQHGFNVWRVRDDYAVARGWNVNPPTPAAMAAGAGASSAVRRINRLPLLTAKTFTPSEAADVLPPGGDTNTIFVVDDNDRGHPNRVTTLDFTNGARFYYFVAGRDLLGRDGAFSAGTRVTICDRLPPDALRGVEVENDYAWKAGSSRHQLRVRWPQAPNLPGDEERIRAYWVYRWTNLHELRTSQANPSNHLIAVIPHTAGAATNSYLDAGPGAPSAPADLGKTFWYTVRAEDSGVCGGNLSPHSAPAFGILRDRTGPASPRGTITGTCLEPWADFVSRVTNGIPGTLLSDGLFQFAGFGVRGDRRVEWMEFRAEVKPPGQTNVLASFRSGRLYFGLAPFVNAPFELSGTLSGNDLFMSAEAGFGDGSSDSGGTILTMAPGLVAGDQRVIFTFAGRVQPLSKDQPCDRHFALGPSETLQPIEVEVRPMLGSREMRLYRRVDDGPLELVCTRVLTNLSPVVCLDDTFPHGGSTICYYASTLDEHGNASALERLGCRVVLESSAPPRPQLAPVTPVGSTEEPQMVLSWFCPSANIDRFEVGIAAVGGSISPSCAPGYLDPFPLSPELDLQPVTPELTEVEGLDAPVLEFKRFLTPRPGGAFGVGDQFVVPVDIQLGRQYIVHVKSIARSGTRSEPSNLEGFRWYATNGPQPDVPWPARPLPPTGNSFRRAFTVEWMLPCGETNGPSNIVVRLSDLGSGQRPDDCPPSLPSAVDPNLWLPANFQGESLFPLVLYRRQVPSADFPLVSGDTVQVSPMMESLAWGTNAGTVYLYDPYVLIGRRGGTLDRSGGLFLRDTHPVISGARYRYSLVRFNRRGEIAETIPAANELEVP